MKAFHEVRSYDSDFMVWHSSYENISFVAHWHKELELIYIRDGQAQISVNDHIFTASGGDLVICDTGCIHYSDSCSMDNSLDFIIFDPNILSSVYQSSDFVHPLVTSQMLAEWKLDKELKNLIATLKTELKSKEDYYKEIVTASLRRFWYRLKRAVPKNTAPLQSDNKRAAMLYDLQQLLAYMETNYMENITLEYAAAKMNFSPSHFSKVFKKLTGINFITYMNMVRIEHAAALLKNTTNKITDIALSCGFCNIRTFNRVFKEITGMTPTMFLSSSDPAVDNIAYYKRKTSEKQFVKNDSLTMVKNK